MDSKEFLKNSDHTGRFIVTTPQGRTFWVEPISPRNHNSQWGDVNPATGTVEGSYGHKYKGSVTEEDSMIKGDGFKEIHTLGIGESPFSFIENLIKT
jgi:hypothetical protein